jgi:hypothetical protein
LKIVQRKVEDEKVKGGLRGSPLLSYLKLPKVMISPE